MDSKLCHSLPKNEGLDILSPALPDALQVSDDSEKEGLFKKSEVVTEQANASNYSETCNNVSKRGSVFA